MKDFWDRNLEALKHKDESLYRRILGHPVQEIATLVPTQALPAMEVTGKENLRYGIYDKEDPLATIKEELTHLKRPKSLSQTIWVFTGLGLGYGPIWALERRPDLFRLIILEPSLDLFVFAMKSTELRPLLTSPKVHILAGDTDWYRFEDLVNTKPFTSDFLFTRMPPLYDWQPDLYQETDRTAKAFAVHSDAAFNVLSPFGNQIFDNRMTNLSQLMGTSSLDCLKDAFKNHPALLISAGPSLESSMDRIREAKGRAVLIAVDSAVVPLMNHGIVPDFVTTLDYRPINAEKLSPEKLPDSSFALVSSVISNPRTSQRLSPSHLFYGFQENDTQKWATNTLEIKQKITPVESVAILNLNLAQMIGADPIVLTGYDFALTSKETDHAKGTVFSWGWHDQPGQIEIPGVNGKPVKTLDFLLDFKTAFETQISKFRRNYINATSAGAHIAGTRVAPLGDLISTTFTSPIDVQQTLETCVRPIGAEEVLTLAGALRQTFPKVETEQTRAHTLCELARELKELVNRQKALPEAPRQLPPATSSIQKRIKQLTAKAKPFFPAEEPTGRAMLKSKALEACIQPGGKLAETELEAMVLHAAMSGYEESLSRFLTQAHQLAEFWETQARLEKRLSIKPANTTDLMELARLYLNKGHGARARELLCAHKELSSPDLLLIEGEAHALCLDFDQAFACWATAVEQSPQLSLALEKIQKRLGEEWMTLAAREPIIHMICIRRAFRLCPSQEFLSGHIRTTWPVSHGKIRQMIAQSNQKNAQTLLELWAPVREHLTGWSYLMARVAMARSDITTAAGQIKEALEQTPKNPEVLALLGQLLIETGKVDQGIARLDQACHLDPTQAVTWEVIGDKLFAAKDFKGAITGYKKCLNSLPNRIHTLKKIGDCFFADAAFDAARHIYQAVLEEDPHNQAVQRRLAELDG